VSSALTLLGPVGRMQIIKMMFPFTWSYVQAFVLNIFDIIKLWVLDESYKFLSQNNSKDYERGDSKMAARGRKQKASLL
jgi:hypothetical protein